MRAIPESLLDKIKKQNQTAYENAEPHMSVQVARAKTTVMDSTYWTVETIRQKEGLGDLAVAARRFKPYGGPNRLYNIYVDNGVVKTAIREFPDYQKEKWKNQFDLGPGSAVAIAFDGEWQRYRKKWQPVTVENPFIFWVDTSNKLYVQLWDDAETKFELAANVAKVKALRGWKNVNIPEIDQGVICAYIKSGKVYYRNYAYQELTKEYAWENEREIEEFSGTAVNLNLFITNDYRAGIVVEDITGKITWFITSRAWAGMAIAPEKFYIRAKAAVKFIEIQQKRAEHKETFGISANANIKFLYAGSFNRISLIENISDDGAEEDNFGLYVIFTTQYELFDLDATDFELVDENDVKFRGQSIQKLSRLDYKIELEDFNNAVGECVFIFKGLTTTNEAGYLFDEFSTTFEPIGLIPDESGPPEVAEIWNEGTEGKEIAIKFTQPLIGDVSGNANAFTITGRELQWVDGPDNNGPMVDKTYEVDSVASHPNEPNTILLTLKDHNWFRNVVGKITVKYDKEIGDLKGTGGFVDDFTGEFTPNDLEGKPNVGFHEKFKVNADATVRFIEIQYKNGLHEETFKITATAKIDFIDTTIVNP